MKPVAKADRLLKIITLLKGRRTVITARQLAEVLETSERTIYRDIQILLDTGFPVEGEAGVGYRLKPGFDIPPIMFTSEQLLAVQLGLKMVKGWSDKDLAVAAEQARLKIEAVIPERLKQNQSADSLLVYDYYLNSPAASYSVEIRQAIKSKTQITLDYQRADGEHSQRLVTPLGLVYWGQKWTMIAWCLLRQDYREFRLDRIQKLSNSTEVNTTAKACNLKDISLDKYLEIIQQRYADSV